MKFSNFFLYLILLCTNLSIAQDVWLQNKFSPNNGCQLSSIEAVNVLINNNSAVFIPGNSVSVSFTVDGGAPTTELLSVGLAAGASWNFTFTGRANLATCGAHVMKAWVSYPSDPNNTNDTLQWIVKNDCYIIPGSVIFDATVCEGANSGTLFLSGWTYGSITTWETSTDGGTTWGPIANTTISENYSNLTTTTSYRVQLDGGFCPDDTSGVGTLTVDPAPLGGNLTSTTHCVSNVNGTLNLTGESGSINFWEYSDDLGGSWNNIANTSNSEPYSGFSAERWYRVQIEGNACPDVYSSTAIIGVDPLTVGGTTQTDQTICENTTTSLDLIGETGTILDWEYSNDMATWNSLGLTTNTISTAALSTETYYRAIVKNGVCSNDTSSIVTVSVEGQSIGGTLSSSQDLCETSPNGTLTLSGHTGSITGWEFSVDDGLTWSNIANTTNTENFAGLSDTTWYRVFFDGTFCADAYSDTAIINIDALSEGGSILNDQLICSGSTVNLTLSGSLGSILDWQSSGDLVTWTGIGNTTTSFTTPAITSNTYYRAILKNGSCPEDTAAFATITVEQPSVGGTISGSADRCASAAAGTLILNGSSGPITQWQYSLDEIFWIPIGNTTTSQNYNSLTDTTFFRVFLDGVACPDAYSDTAVINILPEPVTGVLSASTIICEGETVNLSLTGYIADNIDWQWSQDLLVWNPLVSGVDFYSVSPSYSTFYRVVMTRGACGPATTNQVTVVVDPAPVVSAGADVSIIKGDTTALAGFGGVVGSWSPSLGLSNPNVPTPFAYPEATTTYTYTVISNSGCLSSDSVIVTVNLPNGVDIRNVITTNGDGYNDQWIIDQIEKYPMTEVHVFSIYGVEVFSSMDYQSDWDGTYKGEKLPNGTYYYIVKLPGENELRKGTLTILGNE